jgi:methionyl-tRNA formyltransferase
MKIAICSRGQRGLGCLKILIKEKFLISLVILQNHEVNNLKIKIKNICKKNKIKYLITKNINSEKNSKIIKNIKTDLLILAGFNQILKKHILNIPLLATINLHAGKLPKYRGGSPLNWQIINNEKKIYLTILTANKGIDTGEILYEENFRLCLNETILDIQKKVIKKFPKMLIKVLKNFNYYFKNRRKQTLSNSYYKQRQPDDGEIVFSMPALLIYNTVRSLTPPEYPGAFFKINNKKYIIHSSRFITNKDKNKYPPGYILKKNKNGIYISAKNGIVIIKKFFMNKKIISAQKFNF